MSEFIPASKGVLYLISCASSAIDYVPDFVEQAKRAGWNVCMVITPQAVKFVDISLFEKLTGHPVRSEYKRPEDIDVLPRANAILAFPATFNTLNKWALGITDTLALGILCEYTGLGMPILAIPGIHSSSGLDTHPALPRSLRMLRRHGIHILYEPERYPPNNKIPTERILDTLDSLMSKHAQCQNEVKTNLPSGV
jgi:phosphopantothenoylcysteine synthetase/decarboxylase